MNEFKENLKKIRQEKNVSQKKLAITLQTTQQTISKWEKGILEPSYQDLKSLCKYFDVSADYLLGLSEY